MLLSPEEINLEEFLKDESAREKHRKNIEFLRLAITNVKLSKELGLKEGLTYDCRDSHFFQIMTPKNERAFYRNCKYEFLEPRIVIASHYVFLKNKYIKEPVDLYDFAAEVSKAYKPITENLDRRIIRVAITKNFYSKMLFECNASKTTIRPIDLPVKIDFL
jgi:hypothetical protein